MTEFDQLFPPGPPTDARTYVEALDWTAPAGRPRVLVNLVASLDGHVAVDGRSRGLTDAGDRALFHALRGRVDAVLAGGPTLVVERYGRLVADPSRREYRLGAGRPAEPIGVILSRSGTLPSDVPLLDEPEARVVAFLGAGPEAGHDEPPNPEVAADVSREFYSGLADALGVLRSRYGVGVLLCEGGPTLAGALITAGLVDDLFLTVSPRVAGGPARPSLLGGPGPLPGGPAHATLDGLLRSGSTLFARYRTA